METNSRVVDDQTKLLFPFILGKGILVQYQTWQNPETTWHTRGFLNGMILKEMKDWVKEIVFFSTPWTQNNLQTSLRSSNVEFSFKFMMAGHNDFFLSPRW